MNNNFKLLPLLPLLLSAHASATDGYFAHGYGVKSQGMGGVGIALPQDALAAATNPAGMGLIGDRVDVGLTWFRPIREAEIVGNQPGINGEYKANESKDFFIPEFGYNKVINDKLSLGVSIFGNGGMNTDYSRAIPLFDQSGTHRPGIDMAQLFIAPTVAWKINESNTIGLAINLAYQRFKAKGLQNFDNPQQPATSSLGNVTDRGYDHSYGAGLHFGWIGKINDSVSLGATYQTKTWMTSFDKYKGLFAKQGEFDVPEQYGLGIAVKASPKLTVAADVQRINYSDVDSVGNSISLFAGNQLGANSGPGFGWRDVTAYKVGASYAVEETLTLRAGYNHSSQPIPSSETMFNILAPGVVQDHLTLGATWLLPNKSELSFAYMHAFENKVNGSNSISTPNGGGEANLKMYQDSLGIAYGWNL